MATPDIRNDTIREYIPKLIRALRRCKGCQVNRDIIRRHETYAWSVFRRKRHLSTDSHKIQRKIDGIKEHFEVDNFAKYGEYLAALCDEVIHHPPYVHHYEVDVQWSILDFLLTLAHSPTRALRKNISKIDLMLPKVAEEEIEQEELDMIRWRKEIKEEFVPMPRRKDSSDSELSDWSNDNEKPPERFIYVPGKMHSQVEDSAELKIEEKIVRLLPHLPPLKPPEKEPPYILFDGATSKSLYDLIQHSWWIPSLYRKTVVDSDRCEANFCNYYIEYLTKLTDYQVTFDEPILISEYCLQREIIWMFHSPLRCKFFKHNIHERKIENIRNVTVPSCIPEGLSLFLQNNFCPSMQMMHELRKFIDMIYNNTDKMPQKTIECYVASLNDLLVPIQRSLLDYEQRLIDQKADDVLTILQMLDYLRPSMEMLQCIYELHLRVLLPIDEYPAHICSAYLLASLMDCHLNAASPMETNLASALFLGSVKIFCIIIATWWCEGRLEDSQEEFLVKTDSNHNVEVRSYAKNNKMKFFVPECVSKCITGNRLFLLLLEHTLEAGCTLNLLYELNRINDLHIACTDIQLYNLFLEDLMQKVTSLNEPPPAQSLGEECDNGCINERPEISADEMNGSHAINNIDSKSQMIPDVCCELPTTDPFLLMAFGCPQSDQVHHCNHINALEIYEKLRAFNKIMPMEEMILESLNGILQRRTASINEFVMNLYRDEFKILYHLRNLRKVLLLEASDLMHQFYLKILLQIESPYPWLNPYLLTFQLEDILCHKFPDMTGLFLVKINPGYRFTDKVFDAIDDITINYRLTYELAHVIKLDDMERYNLIFRFLIKVKWGLLALENLKFPRVQRRNTCEKLEMIELTMRRLELLRFWMLYAMRSVHFHLMTQVLLSMGGQLDDKMMKCRNLKEMELMHKSYLEVICDHCLISERLSAIKLGVDQLLNLVLILRIEWNQCKRFMNSRHPLATLSDCDDDSDADDDIAKRYSNTSIQSSTASSVASDPSFRIDDEIDGIETTYIRCHQYLASKLNREVYVHQKQFLSGLNDAFNNSMPHG